MRLRIHTLLGFVRETEPIGYVSYMYMDFPCGSMGKKCPFNLGDVDLVTGLGGSPGGGHATHPTILAWRIPRTEELRGL